MNELQQEAAGTSAQPRVGVLVEVERGQEKHPRRRPGGDDSAGGLDAVHHRHPDVEQDHIWRQSRREFDGGGAIAGFTTHRQVIVRFENHPKGHAQQWLVVDQEHRGHGSSSSVRGSITRTRHPPWGRGPISRVPSYAATRSRMPNRPRPCDGCAPYGRMLGVPPWSTTSTSSVRPVTRTSTRARAPLPPCLSALVSASWTTR